MKGVASIFKVSAINIDGLTDEEAIKLHEEVAAYLIDHKFIIGGKKLCYNLAYKLVGLWFRTHSLEDKFNTNISSNDENYLWRLNDSGITDLTDVIPLAYLLSGDDYSGDNFFTHVYLYKFDDKYLETDMNDFVLRVLYLTNMTAHLEYHAPLHLYIDYLFGAPDSIYDSRILEELFYCHSFMIEEGYDAGNILSNVIDSVRALSIPFDEFHNWLSMDPFPLEDIDLSNANLSGINFSGLDLNNADLSDADLTGANLTDANLTDANLSNANLSGADLTGADLTDANLEGIITDENTQIEIPEDDDDEDDDDDLEEDGDDDLEEEEEVENSEKEGSTEAMMLEIANGIYSEEVSIVDWKLLNKDPKAGFIMLVRELRRGWYLEMNIDFQAGKSSHRVFQSFLPVLDNDETVWHSITQNATESNWKDLDELMKLSWSMTGAKMFLAGPELVGSEVADQAMEEFGFYVRHAELLPVLIWENKELNLSLLVYLKHPEKFAGESMLTDNNTDKCEVFNSLAKAVENLRQKAYYYIQES